jgi:hypothetical protein
MWNFADIELYAPNWLEFIVVLLVNLFVDTEL